ncbi:sensor histidine kinase [Dictyobacter kobayashii]|uniref:histidine kinase n=1 Tax=Dictyobacter kobayashii TaxID=2014872 RepID=A0A402ATD3_9CHLR|nr:HAMP domain-containing sensor histidine kinase [Dictyobacter kobayashii]GCE22410.1 hypothetical protein KDK_62100 [Dictyobacter kobayashii]
MGSQHISIKGFAARPRHSGFRRLFIWYFLGILALAFIITAGLELLGILLIALSVQYTSIFSHNRFLQYLAVLVLIALPFSALLGACLFFAWRLERKISQPVGELMAAVEKICQQDLNFSIQYQAPNQLGDLCYAFNELRNALQASLEREWRKQEEIRTMIATLSHDLRTPVTIIQGHIEGLARAGAGEKRNQRLERYLPVLEASSQRMSLLLNDILLVSALEDANFTIQPEQVKLEDALACKAQVYALQASTHEITFAYAYQRAIDLPQQVTLDLHRLEQILDNLVENALRYTPAHGTIHLTCTHLQDTLSLALHDSGAGIAPEDLPHVFEKFYQSPLQKGHKGAGLGLYTCKQLIEKMGGTISIQNHPAGGCEVTVVLPTWTQTPI